MVDYTFITNPEKYNELINSYRKKYGDRGDFDQLLAKIKFIDEMEDFIKHLLDNAT